MLSIIQLVPKETISHWVDDFLALDSVLFLVSTLLSYWALRHPAVTERFEHVADIVFMLGMVFW